MGCVHSTRPHGVAPLPMPQEKLLAATKPPTLPPTLAASTSSLSPPSTMAMSRTQVGFLPVRSAATPTMAGASIGGTGARTGTGTGACNEADHTVDTSGLQYRDVAHMDLGSKLLAAVKRGDVADMRRLVREIGVGTSVNFKGMWGSTPLIVATQYGHVDAALALLEYNSVFTDGPHTTRASTAAAAAAATATATATALVNIDHINERGASALLHACLEGQTSVVRSMIAQYGSTLAVSPHGFPHVLGSGSFLQGASAHNPAWDITGVWTPLSAACANGHADIVKMFMLSQGVGAGLGLTNPPAAATAAATSNNDVYDFCAPISYRGLGGEAKSSSVGGQAGTIDGRASASASGCTVPIASRGKFLHIRQASPFMVACAYGKGAVIEAFLRYAEGLAPVGSDAQFHPLFAVRDELGASHVLHAVRGADPRQALQSLFPVASAAATALVTVSGVNVNAAELSTIDVDVTAADILRDVSSAGTGPSSQQGRVQERSLAAIRCVDNGGFSALHYASHAAGGEGEHAVRVLLLLTAAALASAVAGPIKKADGGPSADYDSSAACAFDLIAWANLQSKGISSAQTGSGSGGGGEKTALLAYPPGTTALHIAIQKKSAILCQLLLLAGANPHLANSKGLTPLDCAKKAGNSAGNAGSTHAHSSSTSLLQLVLQAADDRRWEASGALSSFCFASPPGSVATPLATATPAAAAARGGGGIAADFVTPQKPSRDKGKEEDIIAAAAAVPKLAYDPGRGQEQGREQLMLQDFDEEEEVTGKRKGAGTGKGKGEGNMRFTEATEDFAKVDASPRAAEAAVN